MTTSIRYNDPLPINTIDTGQAVIVKPRRTGLIIGIIIVVIIVIIIIVVVTILIARSKKTSTTPNNGGGGTTPVPPNNTTCTTNSDCIAPRVCNVAAKRCVDCLADTQCAGGAFPFCRTDTNTCVACVSNSNCPMGAVCSNNLCCDSSPPAITNVLATTSGDSRVQLNLSIKQPVATAKVFVVLQDPTGYGLLSNTCPEVGTSACTANSTCPSGDLCVAQKCVVPSCMIFAAGAFVLLIQSSIGIKLFTGASYQVKVKIVYSCGNLSNVSTDFSAATVFTMPACTSNPNPRLISFMEEVARSAPGGLFLQLWIALSAANESSPGVSNPDFLVGFVIDMVSGVHPNRAEYYIPGVQTMNGPDGFKVAIVPHPGVGTFYARAFNAGGPNNCDGPLGPEFKFTTLGFDASNLRTLPA